MQTGKKSIDTALEAGNQSRHYQGGHEERGRRVIALPPPSRAVPASVGAEAARLPSPPPAQRRNVPAQGRTPASGGIRTGGRIQYPRQSPSTSICVRAG